MTFQYIAWAAAVADFIPYVKGGPLLVAIEQLAGISTRVAGQSWREEGRKRRASETVCHQVSASPLHAGTDKGWKTLRAICSACLTQAHKKLRLVSVQRQTHCIMFASPFSFFSIPKCFRVQKVLQTKLLSFSSFSHP